MRDIYSRCRDVTVYLSDGRNHRPKKGVPHYPKDPLLKFYGDERDQAYIQTFWQALSAPTSPSSSLHLFSLLRIVGDAELAQTLTTQLAHCGGDIINTLAEDLRLMLLSPWWQCMWVVQEIVVPEKAVVRYGALQAPWEMLVAAASSRLSVGIPPKSAKVLRHFSR